MERVGAAVLERAATPADGLPPLAEFEYSPGIPGDFDRLYRASFARIVRTLAGIVGSVDAAEECAQEAFTRAYRAWPSWEAKVPAEAWLHRIAVDPRSPIDDEKKYELYPRSCGGSVCLRQVRILPSKSRTGSSLSCDGSHRNRRPRSYSATTTATPIARSPPPSECPSAPWASESPTPLSLCVAAWGKPALSDLRLAGGPF